MNHQHSHKKGTVSSVAASISSVIFSVIASSHHSLHMLLLVLFGGSTNFMEDNSGLFWVRRVIIIITFITSIYMIYRLKAHRKMPTWMKVMNLLSVFISLGFIMYTLISFGW